MTDTTWMGSQDDMTAAEIFHQVPMLMEEARNRNLRYAVVMPSLNKGKDFECNGGAGFSWKLIGRGKALFEGCKLMEGFSVVPHVSVMDIDDRIKALSIVITW